MTPPEGCHRYRERIGAIVLGKLAEGELASSPPPGPKPATTLLDRWAVEKPKTVSPVRRTAGIVARCPPW